MSHRGRGWAAVALGYAVLALAYVWPLPRHLASSLAHDAGDPLLNAWILEWTTTRVPWKPGWWDAPAFAPMPGALALSEHLLGLWPISAPLLGIGVPVVAVYNLIVIASFALCALTAALLVSSLTRSRLAGIVAGCLWGFAPYRLAQLAHVQILAAWWAPLALLALHRQAEVGGWRWATVFAVCWLWLSLTSGYHLAFFSVVAGIVGLWLFTRRDRLAHARPVVVTTAVAALVLLPLLLGYTAIHGRQGLTRQPKEVDEYAADAAHLLKAPALSLLWGGHSAEYEEVALFPGVGLIGGVLLALVLAVRRTGGEVRRGHGAGLSGDAVASSDPARAVSWRLARTLALLALVPLTLALVAGLNPGQYVVAGLRISLTRPSKPATVACVLVTLAALASPPGRRMLRARSLAGLYTIVALGSC